SQGGGIARVVLADGNNVAFKRWLFHAELGELADDRGSSGLVPLGDVPLDTPVDLSVGPVVGQLFQLVRVVPDGGAQVGHGLVSVKLALGDLLGKVVADAEQFAGSSHARFLLSLREMMFESALEHSAGTFPPRGGKDVPAECSSWTTFS